TPADRSGGRKPALLLDHQREGPVVDQLDVHQRSKASRLHSYSEGGQAGGEVPVNAFGLVGRSRAGETRPASAAGVRIERELGDDQRLAARLRKAQVGLSVG